MAPPKLIAPAPPVKVRLKAPFTVAPLSRFKELPLEFKEDPCVRVMGDAICKVPLEERVDPRETTAPPPPLT